MARPVLRVRPAGWGLPTACPDCLPHYFYMKLAGVDFDLAYCPRLPDSDDLPVVEYGSLAGFANEAGGVEGFLIKEEIAALDADLTETEKSDLQAYKALACSWLADAILYEIWMKENESVVKQIYFSALPWPVNKALEWKMRRAVMQRLGITVENEVEKSAELYKKASEAYGALSARLHDQVFFFQKPSSIDAFLLGHILFLSRVPMETSRLKEELSRHSNLISYADSLDKIAMGTPSSLPVPPPDRRPSSPSNATFRTSSKRPDKEKTGKKKERTEKEKAFSKRARYFVIFQAAAVLTYILLSGIQYEDGMEDDGRDDD